MEFSLFGELRLIFETGGHNGYRRYFDNEFHRIGTSTERSGESATITVRIVKSLPAHEEGDLRASVRVKRLFTFKYLVRHLDTSHVSIYFKTHPVDKVYMNAIAVFLQSQILEPIMYLKFLERDILFMHAAGVSDGTNGYLFAASGGTGKTTFSIALMKCGYRLLGDDLLVVNVHQGMVYPYQRPLHLFTYNVHHLSHARVPLRYKAAIYGKDIVRFCLEKALRTEFLISTRVHADELFDHDPFGTAVPFAKLCFLRKDGPASAVVEISESNVRELARQLMHSADLNGSLYSLLAEEQAIARVLRLEEALIQRLLASLGTMTYINPRELRLDELHQFAEEHLRA